MSEGNLPYHRAGNGFPVVLVHGFLGGSAQWQAEIDHLARSHDVIAPDLFGFGDAADKTGDDRISDMAASVIRLLDSLGIDRFALLGHSMGGMIVQEIAATWPQRIHQLVLYGTGPLGKMPKRFEPLETSRARLIEDGTARTIKRIGATWFYDGDRAEGLALISQIGARASTQAALAAIDAMAGWDGRDSLALLTMPTLIIWGDTDRSYQWPQIEQIWTALPDVRLSVIPRASHAAHLEKPELFHMILDDFLSETPKI